MTTQRTLPLRPAWTLILAASLFGLCACDRNTVPPQQPKTHVIELTRSEPGTSDTPGAASPGAQAGLLKEPYGAAAPMAPGTDGVRAADASRLAGMPTGLDQAPIPVQSPEGLVGATPTGAGVTTAAAAATPTSVALSATEMAFITQASEAGLFDLRIGQLGIERATNSAVKSYAAMLVADQASLNNGLQQLARRLGVPVPSSLSEPKQQLIDGLARTGTVDFDQQFVNAVGVRDHAATIELFERTGRETRHPLVRNFVLNTLPTLRAHLNAAEKLPVKG
jgi:putative membrane protein